MGQIAQSLPYSVTNLGRAVGGLCAKFTLWQAAQHNPAQSQGVLNDFLDTSLNSPLICTTNSGLFPTVLTVFTGGGNQTVILVMTAWLYDHGSNHTGAFSVAFE